MTFWARLIVTTQCCLLLPSFGEARDVRGNIDFQGVLYPTPAVGEGRSRVRIAAEGTRGRWFGIVSGGADGLLGGSARGRDAILRPHDTYLERRGTRVEFRVGVSNLAWGVLDEVSPQDVINPLDVSRFVLEGRADARLPVPLVRTRLFLPADWSLEGVVVPYARRGAFDQLAEGRSPFAPAGLRQAPADHDRSRMAGIDALPRTDLAVTWTNVEGGLRLRNTTGGIDWGLSAYRDIVDFDRYTATPLGLVASRPRRWMVGGDLETVVGSWVIRGDGAFFLQDPLQAESVPAIVAASTFQGGIGADRTMGASTLFLNAVYSHLPDDPRVPAAADELSLVAGFSRDYSRNTRTIRLFGVWNTSAGSGFGRAIWNAELVENLRLEVGAGLFLGTGGLLLGRLDDADFAAARLRFYF